MTWCREYSSLYISVFVHCLCCVFLPVFDPHSAVCRGGGGGDQWHHGWCAGNFVFLYFVKLSFCILYLLYLTHILQSAQSAEEEEGTGGTMAVVQGFLSFYIL